VVARISRGEEGKVRGSLGGSIRPSQGQHAKTLAKTVFAMIKDVRSSLAGERIDDERGLQSNYKKQTPQLNLGKARKL